MGLLITTYVNLVNVWKTSGEAGKQRVKENSWTQRTIKALPFKSEGYNRAKSILLAKYGKESEIDKAYTKEILELPTVPNASPKKICEFGEKLTYCVQALQTMKKLEQVNGAVSMTLDKLPAIRGDLARTDPDWEKWDFAQLSEAIRLWIRRNPVDTSQHECEQGQQQVKGTYARQELFMRDATTTRRPAVGLAFTAVKIIMY